MKIASAFTFHLNHAIEEGLVCVGKCESMCRRPGLVLEKSIARFPYVETGGTAVLSYSIWRARRCCANTRAVHGMLGPKRTL